MKNKKTAKILYWSLVSVLILIIVVCAALISLKLITDAQDEDANAFYRALGFKAYAAGGLAGYYR